MSDRNREGLLWGVPLVFLGIVMLLHNFGLVGSVWDLVRTLMFAAGGILFLTLFQRDPSNQWWALIPSFALIGLSGKELVEWLHPALGRYIGDGIFLGSVGLAFALIYLLRRDQWWPILPAGALLTLSVQEVLENFLSKSLLEGFFLAGIGLAFFLVYHQFRSDERMRWTLPVSLVLLALSASKTIQMNIAWKYIWPFGLIGLGAYLIFQQVSRPK